MLNPVSIVAIGNETSNDYSKIAASPVDVDSCRFGVESQVRRALVSDCLIDMRIGLEARSLAAGYFVRGICLMDGRRRLLWVDGLGGLIVGLIVLLICGWLSELEGLPKAVLVFTGMANLAYGSFSTSLAARSVRPMKLIVLLVIANIAWAPVCLFLAVQFSESITLFGLVHLIGEGLYVGCLGCLEWRWRQWLI